MPGSSSRIWRPSRSASRARAPMLLSSNRLPAHRDVLGQQLVVSLALPEGLLHFDVILLPEPLLTEENSHPNAALLSEVDLHLSQRYVSQRETALHHVGDRHPVDDHGRLASLRPRPRNR